MGDLGLGFDNILDDDGVMSLFGEDSQEEETKQTTEEEETSENNSEENNNTAEVVNTGSYFGDEEEEQPESVGSGEKNNDKENTEDTTSQQETGTSPDFFSSIANAFAEEGIFPDLDEDTVKGIKSAADFRKAIEAQLEAERTEQENRIKKALDNGVEVDKIKQYESLLGYLDSLDNVIDKEGDEGDDARKRLIFQDYINKGFSKERAEKAVNKAFEDGTDKEEAKEALKSNKEFYRDGYQTLLDEAQAKADEEVKEREEKTLRIKKALIEDDIKFLGDMEITKSVRQTAFDAISKPVFKDPKTGETFTALQKLERDNSEDFMVKLGIMYALTNGFKDIGGLINKKVQKEVKKGFSELEKKIKTPSKQPHGDLSYVDNDGRVFLGKGIQLDI